LQTGSFQWMKSLNKSTILNMIRMHGPISRAEIAKLTGLTPPTVTNIVGELLESGLVVESSLGESTGGRKPIMLRINASRFRVIGIHVRSDRLEAASAQLDGVIKHHCRRELTDQPDRETFLRALRDITEEAMKEARSLDLPVLGIGVGMHGLVDPFKGESIFAPHFGLRHVPIRAALEKATGLPVEVENDVRAIALAESWFGEGRDLADFVCVNVDTGIGAGIFLNRELYRGSAFSAGELGHTIVDPDGPPCRCGNHGCLEALADERAIVERAKHTPGLKEKVKYASGLSLRDVIAMAESGEEEAGRILSDAGYWLGIGIANLVNLLNPARVILHGGVARAGDRIMGPLRETVQSRAHAAKAKPVSIVVSCLGDRAAVMGAFTLALKRIFDPAPSD
jgi:N-acetylglucosamine repressor